MKPRQDRPRLVSRVSTVVGIGALVVVALAARSQGGQQTTPPPAVMPTMPPAAVDTNKRDTTQVTDTTAMADSMVMSDSAMMMHTATAAPVAAMPPAWPVDVVTGQTIINGEPVVGRIFIMQKTDGTVKLGKWQAQYTGEPLSAEPAIVGTSYAVPALEHTRRMRGIMIQATLWASDRKRSAVERRHYRPQTTGAALGQR